MLEAGTRDLDELLNLPRNPKLHALREIGGSIGRWGFIHRIIVNVRTDHIIAGNGRVDKLRGLREAGKVPENIVIQDGAWLVPVDMVDLPEGQELSVAVALNRLEEKGGWDDELLAGILQEIFDAEGEQGLVGVGYTDEDIALLAAELFENEEPLADAGPQVDKAAELQEKWQVQTGDLWQCGRHRVLCGDCTEQAAVERVMDGEKAAVVITDPPYGQNQDGVTNDAPDLHESIINSAVRNLPIKNAVCAAFNSPRTFPVWLDAIREHGHKFERMLWMYKEAQETYPWRGWLLKSEAILVSSKGKAPWQDVHPYSHDCYKMSELSNELLDGIGWHGSVKPLDVVEDLIRRTCGNGEIVYDGFLGSGTAMLACENLNRQCRGIEIEPRYVAVTLERYYQATGDIPERLSL